VHTIEKPLEWLKVKANAQLGILTKIGEPGQRSPDIEESLSQGHSAPRETKGGASCQQEIAQDQGV
jgi:hypothetical protein